MFQFITNIKNGFLAANETRKVVLQDPVLLAYPVLAALASAAIVIVLLVIFGLLTLSTHGATINLGILYIFFAALYIAVAYTTTFFLLAMLLAFRDFAKGKKISIGASFGEARPYAMLVLEWVIFFFIIKVLIDIIEGLIRSALRRFGMFGNIISGIITGAANLALTVVTLFAIPVIIDEKTDPIDTLKTSTKFIMKNWGETLGGFAYAEIFQYVLAALGAFMFLIALFVIQSASGMSLTAGNIEVTIGIGLLVGIVIFALALSPIGSAILFIVMTFIAASEGALAGITVLLLTGLGVCLVLMGHVLKYVLFNCFTLVVYDYKTRGVVPKGFDKNVIDGAIITKQTNQQQGGSAPTGGGFSSSGGKDPFS